jgi:hypothetical protein
VRWWAYLHQPFTVRKRNMPTREASVVAGSNSKPLMLCLIPSREPLESAFVSAL